MKPRGGAVLSSSRARRPRTAARPGLPDCGEADRVAQAMSQRGRMMEPEFSSRGPASSPGVDLASYQRACPHLFLMLVALPRSRAAATVAPLRHVCDHLHL